MLLAPSRALVLARAAHRVRAQLDPTAAVDLKLFRARAAAAAEPMLAPLQPIQRQHESRV